MKLYITLIKKEILEQFRTSKIVILIFLYLFVAVASPILAKMMPEIFKHVSTPGLTINIPTPTYKDSIDQFIKNISQIPIFIIVFLVAGAVSEEKAKKTLEIVLTKPIQRSVFLLSKFKAYFASIGLGFVLASIIFYFYTYSIFGSFSAKNFAIIALLVLLYLTFAISIAFLGSVIAKNTVSAGAISLVGLILFGTVVNSISLIAKFSPSYILGNYQKIVENGWSSNFLPSIIATAVLIADFTLISLLLFKNQEVER
jgi:ABC-2 type transport system permease protein